MTMPYKTYDEIQEALTNPRSYAEGGTSGTIVEATGRKSPIPQNTTTTQAAEQASPAQIESAPPLAISSQTSTTSVPTGGLITYTGNPNISERYKGMLQPITSQLGTSTNKLGTIAQDFATAAGSERTWEGIKGSSQVQQALLPSASDMDIAAAKSLAQAAYTGPTTLDQTTMDELKGTLQNLQDTGRAIQGGAGTEALLQTLSKTPGTPQELQWDTQRLMADPDYLRSVQALAEDIGGFGGQITRQEQAAATEAATRTAEEADIASKAQAALTGEMTGLDTTLQGRLAQEQANQKAIEDAYAKFSTTGDLHVFDALPQELKDETGITSLENDPNQILYQKGQETLKGIISQFQDIQDIPFMVPQTTSRGLPVIGWSPEDYAALQTKYPDRTQLEQIRQRANDRQLALTQAGFDPSSMKFSIKNTGGEIVLNPANEMPSGVGPGAYSTMFPEYYGGGVGDYTPPSLRSYVSVQPSSMLSKENLATSDELARFNRAADILGLPQMTSDSTPYEKEKVVTQAAQYIEDVASALEMRKGALNKEEQNFLDQANQARKAYRDAQLNWNPLTIWMNPGPIISAMVKSGFQPGETMAKPSSAYGH